MKSERGISLNSLMIYLVAMTIVIATVARISTYFYKNLETATTNTTTSTEFVKFNMHFTKEINISGNYINEIGDTYIIFEETNNQYTFSNNAIYKNNTKICSNIDNCTFSMSSDNIVLVELLIDNELYVNAYRIY